jgi:hypothetical protein
MLGFVFFSVPVDPINLMGIAIGYALSSSPASQPPPTPHDSPSPIAFHRFTGSVYYSVVKYFEQQQTQPKPALAKV